MSFRLVPKSVTLNDLERRNSPYFSLFHRIRVRYVVVKQLLGLPRFQNLLLIVCDHIDTKYCLMAHILNHEARSASSYFELNLMTTSSAPVVPAFSKMALAGR